MTVLTLKSADALALFDGFSHLVKSPALKGLYGLAGIHVKVTDAAVTVLATDRFIAARRTLQLELPDECGPGVFTLDAKALDSFQRSFKESKSGVFRMTAGAEPAPVTLDLYGSPVALGNQLTGQFPYSVNDAIDKAMSGEHLQVGSMTAFSADVLLRLARMAGKAKLILKLPEKQTGAVGFQFHTNLAATHGAVMPYKLPNSEWP